MDELTNLQGTITKLREDIDDLTAKRSTLQNDIEARKKAAEDKIAQSQQVAQADIDTKYAELKKAQNDSAQQIKKDKEELQHRYAEVYKAEEGVKSMIDELKSRQAQLEAKIEVENNKISAQQAKIDQDMQAAIDLEKATNDLSKDLLVKKEQLDNREFQLDEKARKIEQEAMDLISQQNLLSETSASIKKDKQAIIDEKEDNLKVLEAIKAANVLQSTVANDILAKKIALDKEVQDLEVERGKFIADSKNLALKKVDIEEQEKALMERQRLFNLESRKIEDRITVLNKLRAEIAAQPK